MVKNLNRKQSVLWITCTAVFIALLIVMQAATAPLGNSIVTGSIVNLLLVTSVMTCGLSSGLTVAAVSPVMAKFLGIGPLWSLIPFIAAGDVAGAVLLLTDDKTATPTAEEQKAIWIAAAFLAKQMEE